MEERRWAVLGALAAVFGGVGVAVLPLYSVAVPALLDVAWIPALLLLGAVVGLPAGLSPLRDSTGRTGLGLVGGGLAFVVLGAGIRAWALTLSPPRIGLAIALGFAGLGLLIVAFGSIVVGVVLWRTGTVPGPLAGVFAVSLPLDPVLTVVVWPDLGVGVSLYGIAWVVLGLVVVRSLGRER